MTEKNQFVSDGTCFNSYAKGWQLILGNFGILLAVTVIVGLLRAPTDFTDDYLRMFWDNLPSSMIPPLIGFSLLWSVFLAVPISMSASWVSVKAARGDRIAILDMFSVFGRNYWSAVGAGLLSFLIIVLGLLLLIVPGIYFACRLVFVGYLVIDRKMTAGEAISTSWSITGRHQWTVIGMVLLAVPIFVGGLLACVVGIFIAAMWVEAAFAVLYHTIELQEGIPEPGEAQGFKPGDEQYGA